MKLTQIKQDNKGRERLLNPKGYVVVVLLANKKNRLISEHKLIVEEKLRIKLPDGISIHHRNRDKQDNSFLNLKVFLNKEAHVSFHKEKRKLLPVWIDWPSDILWLYWTFIRENLASMLVKVYNRIRR